MKKIVHIVFTIATLLSFVAVARWVFNTTAGFNRQLDLLDTVAIIFFVGPLALTAVLSTIHLVGARKNPEEPLSIGLAVILSLIMIPLSIAVNPGPVHESVFADSMRPTDDGLFEYRLELVNLFQRNVTARLFVRDLTTLEEFHIPLSIPRVDEIGSIGLPHGREFLWGKLEKDELMDQYIFRMPAGGAFQSIYIDGVYFQSMVIRFGTRVTFEIDIPSRTAVMIE